jgi:hypothetical protein
MWGLPIGKGGVYYPIGVKQPIVIGSTPYISESVE